MFVLFPVLLVVFVDTGIIDFVCSYYFHIMAPSVYVSERIFGGNHFADDPEFQALCHEIESAIEQGIEPILAKEGSSGTYFMRDRQGKVVAVFKPKDEEPFAPLNPKWPKFFQRICCPCCFGRHCLLTNHGYLAEVGASLIAERLQLGLVPKTRAVWLSCSKFNYPQRGRNWLHPKVGSLQMFVDEYEDSGVWLKRWETGEQELDESQKRQLLLLMQKMMVLDYVIRNTDRSPANWLIHYEQSTKDTESSLKVAIIDNGLAFPFKHPVQESRLRPFPFYWATLQYAKEPFLPEIHQLLTIHLTDPLFIHHLGHDLRRLFKIDPTFNQNLFDGQLRVLRGQMWNLLEVLERGGSPADLAEMSPVAVTLRNVTSKSSIDSKKNWRSHFHVRSVEQAGCCVIM